MPLDMTAWDDGHGAAPPSASDGPPLPSDPATRAYLRQLLDWAPGAPAPRDSSWRDPNALEFARREAARYAQGVY
jgi:hypothetical protein